MKKVIPRLSNPEDCDFIPLIKLNLQNTPSPHSNQAFFPTYKGSPITLKNLKQERYIKQRSLSNSPISRFGLPKTHRKATDQGPFGLQVIKVAETELQWNEVKKDLQKSPRTAGMSQNLLYLNNCNKLARTKDSSVQNANYNFYNYSINFSCNHEPRSVIINDSDNLWATFDQGSLKELSMSEAKSSTTNPKFHTNKPNKVKSQIRIGGFYKNSEAMKNGENIARKSSGTAAPASDDKLLHMILEVKANLEEYQQKHDDTVHVKKPNESSSIKKGLAFPPSKRKSKDENATRRHRIIEIAATDENIKIDTKHFCSLRDSSKPMIKKQIQRVVIDMSKSGAESDRKNANDKANVDKLLYSNKGDTSTCSKGLLSNKACISNARGEENERRKEANVKMPYTSKDPHLMNSMSAYIDSTIRVVSESSPKSSATKTASKSVIKERHQRSESKSPVSLRKLIKQATMPLDKGRKKSDFPRNVRLLNKVKLPHA